MIADDTPLLPEVIAYSVIQEARTFGVKFFDGLDYDHLIQKDGEYYVPSPAFVTIAYGKFPAKSSKDVAKKGSKPKFS